MKKLRELLQRLMNGEKVRGLDLSALDISECVMVYNEMLRNRKPSFINGNVKEVLDKCGIETKTEGVGWRVV